MDLDAWRDLARPVYDVRSKGARSAFRAAAKVRRVGGMIASHASFSSAFYDHDPCSLNVFNNDYLVLERYLRGSNFGLLSDQSTRIDAGSIQLVDMSLRYRTSTTEAESIAAIVPHDLVGFDRQRHPRYVSLGLDTPVGQLLDVALQSFVATAKSDPDHRSEDLSMVLLDLIARFMLGIATESGTARRQPGRKILAFERVERSLQRQDLSPEVLCRELGISRASLFRYFEEHGGVRRFINDRRLDRCMNELRTITYRRGVIGEVAERWGFQDSGNFHRMFRAKFGVAPIDCVERAGDRTADDNSLIPTDLTDGAHSEFHCWMRRS